MNRNRTQGEPKKPNWFGIAIVLLLVNPTLFIPLGIFGGLIWLVAKNVSASQQNGTAAAPQKSFQSRQEKFDDCPQSLFCFHKDKGEHHVSRGKEIDPWDRPDIDISKYQRKR